MINCGWREGREQSRVQQSSFNLLCEYTTQGGTVETRNGVEVCLKSSEWGRKRGLTLKERREQITSLFLSIYSPQLCFVELGGDYEISTFRSDMRCSSSIGSTVSTSRFIPVPPSWETRPDLTLSSSFSFLSLPISTYSALAWTNEDQ